MLVNICIAKIHRATVTDANLDYVGSITIDEDLTDAVGLFPGQMVQITNVANAALWRTYIVRGERGSGAIVLNGPPARLFQRGDKVIIIAEAWIEHAELEATQPAIVFVDDQNKITRVAHETVHRPPV